MRKFIPKEFARQHRPLSEYLRGKATEFRQFLLYSGPVVLCNLILDQLYKNFLLLSVAIRILADKKFCVSKNSIAHTLLVSFVKHYAELFGQNHVVYNVHGLVHLADDSKKFGLIDDFSSFPYENYLGRLKRLVRKPTHVIEQIILRLTERTQTSALRMEVESKNSHNIGLPSLKRKHFCGPVPRGIASCEQFQEISLADFMLSIKRPNNCVKVGKDIGVVVNILQDNFSTRIVFQKFEKMAPFFTYPFNSRDIDVFLVSDINIQLHHCNVLEVTKKMVLLPFRNDLLVAMPLLHF